MVSVKFLVDNICAVRCRCYNYTETMRALAMEMYFLDLALPHYKMW